MIQSVGWAWTIFFFILALGPLVFFHELGHYLVARWCGVKAEVFSVGFGREILGWTDKRGTRWKIAWLPLGGYVRFAGDANAASQADESWQELSDAEKAHCLPTQPAWKKILISFAGPGANFLLAILIYAGLFTAVGRLVTPPVVGSVVAGSAAAKAGLVAGDSIIDIDGKRIDDFEDIFKLVAANPGHLIPLTIARNGKQQVVNLTPSVVVERDRFGNTYRLGRIGIGSVPPKNERLSLIEATVAATEATASNISLIAYGLWQLVTGRQSVKDLGGPIMIAKTSGEVATGGWIAFLSFLAFMSINLGFINLLPIPVLDGGHIVFNTVEALRGKPLNARVVEWVFMAGFFMLMSLMVFVTINDLTRYGVFNRLAGLIG